MKKVNQLKAGAILSYISLGLTNIISIVYTPIMLRLLGQSEYGLYNLSNSVIGYLGVLDFGLGNAIVRYTAKYRAEEDKEGESNLNGLFIIVYSIIAILVMMCGGILCLNINNLFSKTLSIEEISRMKILMTLMIFNLAISLPGGIFGAIITAYERFIFPKVLGIIRAIINPLIMIPLLFMGYKSIGMTIITTAINLIYIFVNMYYCFKILKIKIRFKNLDFSILKEVMGYSFFVFLGMIVDKIYWSTDQFILGAIKGTTIVAIYAVGSTFNTYYMNFSTAISGVFLPKVTKMVTKNATDKELSDLFIKVGRIQFIIMSFILSGFLLVGENFINIWAGKGYEDAYLIALVVMIPLTIPLIQNMGITILQAKNMQKFRSNVYIGIAILNVMLSIPLARLLGGLGCALATSFAMILGNIIIINIYYYKKIHINIPLFWKNISKMSIPVVISLFLSELVKEFIDGTGFLSIILIGSIFTLIFIPLMWCMGMNNYEKGLFISPIKKMLKKYNY
ncbi:flippase [Clostridium botulinum]|uniref:oligosaccharide flippase family protein n=1 Tax=Clostridium botulinum TaxID=1491 RepID=UPI000773EF1A|nr:oligosaccharide flippase family protein [Clostridium botulinum]NFH81210.1 flippase [Clostridium botulinum]NFH84268.1 flippase [Clostridium botulinum]NFI12475.1 flippase [Clostridium botulinum]NFI15358.1 flippase [Clostridium botulinum]NFO85640.1 flippase [Clostridium botulinum]